MYAAGITYTGVSSVSAGSAASAAAINFAVDDGQPGSPVNGQTDLIAAMLQGQSLEDVQLLVIREGIALVYNSPVQVNMIRRYNSGGQGGFSFEPASGLAFFSGERYMIFITSNNTTIET